MEITITETLFGGLLAVALLFFAARRLGLPRYWSGVLAGLVPFLAYLGYSLSHAQGGDVLAIHFVVFMAGAAVLGVFSGLWGRQEKMHWGPKIIISFFVFLVLFNAFLLSVAMHGLPDAVSSWLLPNPDKVTVHTAFPGVVPHDQNKLYEPHQQQLEQQRNLGWQVEVQGLDQLKSGVPGTLRVIVRDAQGQPLQVDRVALGFWRMADSRDDHTLELQPGAPGEYQTEVTLADAGRWVSEIHVERGQDVFHTKRSLLVDTPQ